MPPALAADKDTVSFELDSFEPVGGRLEVKGRWFGVRGRRFVRPTLRPIAARSRSRVLAELEHKPWAPEDGEPWIAAFAWDAADPAVGELELAVAPDIAVVLPAPGSRSTGLFARVAPPPEPQPLQSQSRVQVDEAEPERIEAEAPPRDCEPELGALRQRLERAELDRLEAQSALARAELEASRAQEQLEASGQARETAQAQRDRAIAARDQAISARDRSDAARDEAIAARDRADSKLRALSRSHEQLSSELQSALASRDAALDRLQQLGATQERLDAAETELERLRATTTPAVRPGREVRLPSPTTNAAGAPMRAEVNWARRVLALAVLLAAIIALAIVFRVL